MFAYDAFTHFKGFYWISYSYMWYHKYPPPSSTNEVTYALHISFSLQKGNFYITVDVWSSVVQIK